MLRIVCLASTFLCLASCVATTTAWAWQVETFRPGEPASPSKRAPFAVLPAETLGNHLQLSNVWGQNVELAEIWRRDLLVAMFMGTECPVARLYVGRFESLASEFSDAQADFVLVDANIQDSLSELQRFQRENELTLPLLKDVGHRFTDQVTAERTPEVFVIDRDGEVVYRGRIDDQYLVGQVRSRPTRLDLKEALQQHFAGKPITVANTPVEGCIIGRMRTPSEGSESDSSVTYATHVADILNRHCVECHRPGDIGPMPLVDYQEVAGWAETILEVVQDHRMPPWHAEGPEGAFHNERVITDAERETLRQWVELGTPAGDLSQLPPSPKFASQWRMETAPDQVIAMSAKPFDVPAQGVVDYQYYVVDPGWQEDRWIRASQVLPGNSSVVHHAIVFVRSPNTTRFDGLGWLGGYVPGQNPMVLAAGQARLIPAGSKLVFQMHYTPTGLPQQDVTRVGIWFADEEAVEEEVLTAVLLNQNFEIPPHASGHRVTASISGFPEGSRLLALTPHMHVRGESFHVWHSAADVEAVDDDTKPQARTNLLNVPRYDFNWQHTYEYASPVVLSDDSTIEFESIFNNSELNLANPDPNVAVRWGDQTWEEMALVFLTLSVPRGSQAVWQRENQGESTLSAEDKARQCLGRFDRNKDGFIQRREAPEAFAAFAFVRFDRDNDNRLSLAELIGSID